MLRTFTSAFMPRCPGSIFSRLAPQFFCAALVALGWVLLAPSAKASCGYYVVSTNPSSELISQPAMPAAHLPAAPADCPCRGPQCGSGQNSATPIATAPSVSLDSFAAIFADWQPARQLAQLLHSPQWLCLSEGHLLAIDPPPRA
jgi:hypothetical protein